jgi:two-component system, chemotaxis family, protein-glutamate methylesterase/glutaminase
MSTNSKPAERRLRVLIVDDAVVMRRMITEVLSRDPGLEVIGTAANGRLALQKIAQTQPDVITLDVEMPEMDGVATVREIRKQWPRLPVIMFSTLTQRGAAVTLDALAAGATDYVTKPANVGSITEGMQRLEHDLVPKIKLHCLQTAPAAPAPIAPAGTRPTSPSAAAPGAGGIILPPRTPLRAAAPSAGQRIDVVAIGSSTGGPNALADLFPQIPGGFEVPILVVQHMPPVFTKMLAERLGRGSKLRFHEGENGMPVQAGHVYIAPGGHHMEVVREDKLVKIRLQDGPPENSCRPAVDVLFRSVAQVYGSHTLAVILTGMGSDGLKGCTTLRERGAPVFAQDQATSVVWGMPGYVSQAGLAEKILPLPQIAPEIARRVAALRQPIALAA